MADFSLEDLMQDADSLPKNDFPSVLRFLAAQGQDEIMLVLSKEAALDLAERLEAVPAHHDRPLN